MSIENRVKETSSSTGTGNLTLAGAVTAFVTFNSVFGTNSLFRYWILHDSDNTWECGVGHLSASTTLVRDFVFRSTNSDSAVNFASGGLTVFCDGLGSDFTPAQIINTTTNWPRYTPYPRNTTINLGESTVYYAPWYVRTWFPNGFDNFQFYASAAIAFDCRVGLYDCGLDGLADNLLWESSELVGASGTGNINGALGTTRKIIPGNYWLAFAADDDGSSFDGATVHAQNNSLATSHPFHGSVTASLSPEQGYTQSAGYTRGGSLPSSPSFSGHTTTIPVVCLTPV